MCWAMLEELTICLVIMIEKETHEHFDNEDVLFKMMGREYECIEVISKQIAKFPDIKFSIHNLFKRKLNRDNMIQEIIIGITALKYVYEKEAYNDADIYDQLWLMYDSQYFCQLCLPILDNPILYNKYKKYRKIVDKKRKGRISGKNYNLPKLKQTDLNEILQLSLKLSDDEITFICDELNDLFHK